MKLRSQPFDRLSLVSVMAVTSMILSLLWAALPPIGAPIFLPVSIQQEVGIWGMRQIFHLHVSTCVSVIFDFTAVHYDVAHR
jgi:hypothetical protein